MERSCLGDFCLVKCDGETMRQRQGEGGRGNTGRSRKVGMV